MQSPKIAPPSGRLCRLVRVAAFIIGIAMAGGGSPVRSETFSGVQIERLNRALESLHAQYDRAERMVRTPFSSPGYHTTLKGGWVHPTRTSLQYAVALLDTGDDALKDRACAILERVVALQDQNPKSRTYGIWSWFMEEPLDRMSPPDWNWADFCGALLIQAAQDHGDRLPPELAKKVEDAIQHAARSVQRRNVGPGYTNIAIMGTYVTLRASEMFKLGDLHEYAMERLRGFHRYTKEQGAFTEYNSPTYTVVALEELGRMRRDVRTPEAQGLIEELYRTAWDEIAEHFHPPTRQWAGPHSRCYRTLLGDNVLALIQRATSGRIDYKVDKPSLFEHRLALPCPPELEERFIALTAPRRLVKTFVKGERPVIGTTYLHPAFALGSVNRGDLWNQRRPLLAYWGNAETPGFLRLRLLRDDYDFSAAQFFSVQTNGAVLAAINFAIDGGNTHVSLDRLKEGRVTATDLRLRFEFGGAAAALALEKPESLTAPVGLTMGGMQLDLAVLHAAFGDGNLHWEVTRRDDTSGLDLVLYHGPEKVIDLTSLSSAVIGLVLRLSAAPAEFPRAAVKTDGGELSLAWGDLRLRVPSRPGKAADLHKAARWQEVR